ncbi:TetR/AcrR family transcriptional regulator [Psychrobacter sp.]|uniref:TetR/AcrR family transcriptional regulator n=1 Tax=Psychrobacter sp. TaxID=56811 RepID=UPI0025E70A69|nr:TetR/AcrR family transcriptional regulator [Psychrobacter sp.]
MTDSNTHTSLLNTSNLEDNLEINSEDKKPVTPNNSNFFKYSPNDTKSHLIATGYQLLAKKGFTAVGIKQILETAGVPKGSFYHYFASKEAFGETIIESYFEHYKHRLEEISDQNLTAQQKLCNYFQFWYNTQQNECDHEKCLVVKLSAEVSDISVTMREALEGGYQQTIDWITHQVNAGWSDNSIPHTADISAESIAKRWYYAWLGASLIAKTSCSNIPLAEVWQMTATELGCESIEL